MVRSALLLVTAQNINFPPDWDDDLGSSDSSDSDTQPKHPSFKKLVAYHEPQSMLVVESGPLVTSFRLARRSSEKGTYLLIFQFVGLTYGTRDLDTHNEFGDCDMLGEGIPNTPTSFT